MRTIRASEIGAFLYCRRAWWYRRQGIEPENQAELERGSGYHAGHGRAVYAARLMRSAGWLLLLLALGLFTAALVTALLP
jgi:hypothetical protein